MSSSLLTSSSLRRFAVALCASSLVAVSLSSGGAAAALPVRMPTIDTHKAWNGTDYIWPFGRPDTSTYGQVITIPNGMSRLTKFNFYLAEYEGSGSLVLRGEVYAWDGTKATGPAVWESHPRTVSYGDSDFHRKQFRPHGVDDLQPGAQYVLFASISKDYEECTDGYELKWATVPDETYPEGTLVFSNDSGDESMWTSTAWESWWGADMAFKAWLS
jgi:hypothetical protein